MINIRDANGAWVTLKEEDVTSLFRENFSMVFGLTMEDIAAMRYFCLRLGVTLPMSKENLTKLAAYYSDLENNIAYIMTTKD